MPAQLIRFVYVWIWTWKKKKKKKKKRKVSNNTEWTSCELETWTTLHTFKCMLSEGFKSVESFMCTTHTRGHLKQFFFFFFFFFLRFIFQPA